MAVTVQMQFTSAVTEIYQDAFVGSAIENGTTIIQFDLRKHDFQSELGTKAKLCWRQDLYNVDIHELATFHNPIKYRFIVATVKNIWGHLKKALLSYRRQLKSSGEAKNDQDCIDLAKKVWKLRWSLLKKPTNSSAEEKQAIAELEREEEGFVRSFRSIIRQVVNLFDHSHSEVQAKLRLKQLRKDIRAVDDDHLEKILTFFADHWEQALRYLRKKGMGKHRRGSNSESGMRLLRRLEKNHDGIRSAATRQHYIQNLSGDQVPLPRYCRVYRERPSNDRTASCVKGGTHSIRDPQGKFDTQALLCTKLEAAPVQVLEWFVRRWQVEVTFEEARAHLGMEIQRQESDKAVPRTTPCVLGLYALIILLAERLREQQALTVRREAWYAKENVTFSDTLAMGRRWLWADQHFQMSQTQADMIQVPRSFFERLTETLCYAA
jgi:hypothetical protein